MVVAAQQQQLGHALARVHERGVVVVVAVVVVVVAVVVSPCAHPAQLLLLLPMLLHTEKSLDYIK